MAPQVGEGIAIGCFVSFSPGKEQRVFFGVHGSLLGRADELVAVPALLSGDADAVVSGMHVAHLRTASLCSPHTCGPMQQRCC